MRRRSSIKMYSLMLSFSRFGQTSPSNSIPPASDELSLLGPDWRLLSNIIHAYDTSTNSPQFQRFLATLSASSTSADHHLLHLSPMFTHIQGSLQSFIASSPDFRILTTSEQRSLFHRNLPGVLGFGSIFFFHRADSLCFNLLARIYEPPTVASLNTIHQRFDLDSTTIGFCSTPIVCGEVRMSMWNSCGSI